MKRVSITDIVIRTGAGGCAADIEEEHADTHISS